MFGGDKSDSFSNGLTDAIEVLLRQHTLVKSGRRKWEKIVDDMRN